MQYYSQIQSSEHFQSGKPVFCVIYPGREQGRF
jgi:hypothetical protein